MSPRGAGNHGLPFINAAIGDAISRTVVTAAGAMTAIVLLAFGAFAPLAPRLTRRVSIERVLGLIVAPGAALAWIVVFGIGQGGALGLGLILPVLRGGDAASVASLTAMSLCVGFVVAAAGPWLLGAVHDATGGWTVALVALAAICVLELAPGLPAARARILESSG